MQNLSSTNLPPVCKKGYLSCLSAWGSSLMVVAISRFLRLLFRERWCRTSNMFRRASSEYSPPTTLKRNVALTNRCIAMLKRLTNIAVSGRAESPARSEPLPHSLVNNRLWGPVASTVSCLVNHDSLIGILTNPWILCFGFLHIVISGALVT